MRTLCVDSLLMMLVAGALAGCAGIKVQALPATEAGAARDQTANGFRYYETAPFLLMYTDGKGGVSSKLLYLPDMAKKRTIHVYSYLAKNDTTLKFSNGSLVQAKAEINETVVPVAAIAAVEKIGAALYRAANGGQDGIPVPQLYRLVSHGASGQWELRTLPTTMHDGSEHRLIFYKQGDAP